MVCKIVSVYMANHEWGNELMRQLAQETFKEFPNADVVEVVEHGGWWLMFRRDMAVVGSANDCACYPREIVEWNRSWTDHRYIAFVNRAAPIHEQVVAA